jgi:membrane associated rhomboid family serine protease
MPLQRAREQYSLMPPVIKFLLLSNSLIFLLEVLFGVSLIRSFALWPILPDEFVRLAQARGMFVNGFEPWQLVSYAFLHGNSMHLLLNMYALWMFGIALENRWGSARFALYYLVCVAGAGFVQLLVVSLTVEPGHYYPTIGASGGVFGVLLAYGMMFPRSVLILLFPPIPIEARWFVLIYGAIELFFGITGTDSGVAHFAHLGGMFFGYLLIRHWRGLPPARPGRLPGH